MPQSDPPNPPDLPSTEQTREHLEGHPVQLPNPWWGRLPLIALGAVGILLFAGGSYIVATMPWVILLALFVTMALRAGYMRKLDRAVTDSQALAMRRCYEQALSRSWQLVPTLVRQPQLRHRAAAVMAHCLDDLGCDEAALIVYDHLMDELPEEHPGLVQLQTHRAIAALSCDRLADGDEALRRVQKKINANDGTLLAAAYQLGRLLQEVRTHHYREATQRDEDFLAKLRPLGVEAGFGHALLAWCHYQAHQRDAVNRDAAEEEPALADEQRDDESAPDHHQWMRWWWHNATLLLPPAAIIHRFPEVTPLTRQQPQ